MIEIIASTGKWLTDWLRVTKTCAARSNWLRGDNCDKTHLAHPYNLDTNVNGHTDIRI